MTTQAGQWLYDRVTAKHPLPYKLRFEDRAGYLYAEASGPADSVEITTDYWREIEKECALRGAKRLLVCDRLRGSAFSPEEFARLAPALLGGVLPTLRIAFYEPVSENLRLVEFGELSMREAGFVLRVFGSEREAEVWLLYGEFHKIGLLAPMQD